MNASETCRQELTQPIRFVKGIGPRRAALLEKLGVRTAADLLFFFPRRYENFIGQSRIDQLQLDQAARVIGVIDDIDETKTDGRHVLYVLLKQGECFLRAIWFNQAYMLNRFRLGQTVQFRGKVSERGGRLQMVHPEVIWIDQSDQNIDERMLPVYRLTEGLGQRQMRETVAQIVETFSPLVVEALPEDLRQSSGLCDIQQAIRDIHAPPNEERLASARHRLVFQELLILQLALAMRMHRVRSRATAAPMKLTPKIRSRILGRLPFELRPSQRQAWEEIAADMGESHPMNRLLHGEVGSGKTVLAACAMLLAAAHSHQAVLMVPTEILANQHFQTLRHLLAGSRVSVALCTAGSTARERAEFAENIRNGTVDLIVGTTAVVNANMTFARLGLVVIDEQHKFGVRQRALLKQAGFDPHYLVMTATPIPRTITMTLFGDLEVSTLRHDARSRTSTRTYIGNQLNRSGWWDFFRKKLREGRQGFVIAPLVDSDDESGLQSVERLFESLANGPLEEFRITLLHGRQSTAEKIDAIDQFATGKIQVLVATGVVEVGIDVPNATVMTIESAERFGLSQLHQLRGRVGRGQHPGYVCAFPSPGQATANERLQAFAEIDDGFELARVDMKLRGPGNLLSTRQTGFPPLRIADLVNDESELVEARRASRAIIEQDPCLAHARYEKLRQLVLSRYGRVLDLGDVG